MKEPCFIPLDEYAIFNKEEVKLFSKVFMCDDGEKLCKLLETKLINQFVANPEKSSNWAFFIQGQRHAISHILHIVRTQSNPNNIV